MAIAVIVDWYGPYSSKQLLRGEMRCPSQNSSLKGRILDDCVVVYSRFFNQDGDSINPLPRFPKVIAFNAWSEAWDAWS